MLLAAFSRVHAIAALVLFISIIVLVGNSSAFTARLSTGNIPSPVGHALAQIEGFFSGDTSLADSLGKLQKRVTGACAAGEAIAQVNADGTVVCQPASAAATLSMVVSDEVSCSDGIGGSSTTCPLFPVSNYDLCWITRFSGPPTACSIAQAVVSGVEHWQLVSLNNGLSGTGTCTARCFAGITPAGVTPNVFNALSNEFSCTTGFITQCTIAAEADYDICIVTGFDGDTGSGAIAVASPACRAELSGGSWVLNAHSNGSKNNFTCYARCFNVGS